MGNSEQPRGAPPLELSSMTARLDRIDVELEELLRRVKGLEVREADAHPPTTQKLVQDYGRRPGDNSIGPAVHDRPNPFAPEGHASDDVDNEDDKKHPGDDEVPGTGHT